MIATHSEHLHPVGLHSTHSQPLIEFFYFNNTASTWINAVNKTHPESQRHQFVHLYGISTATALGTINLTVDDFFVDSDNLTFALFNQTTLGGTYNVSIFVNDTVGNLNNTETTTFNVSFVNTAPNSPIIFNPSLFQIIIYFLKILLTNIF